MDRPLCFECPLHCRCKFGDIFILHPPRLGVKIILVIPIIPVKYTGSHHVIDSNPRHILWIQFLCVSLVFMGDYAFPSVLLCQVNDGLDSQEVSVILVVLARSGRLHVAHTQAQFSESVASMRPYFVRLSYPWTAQEVALTRTRVASNKAELQGKSTTLRS